MVNDPYRIDSGSVRIIALAYSTMSWSVPSLLAGRWAQFWISTWHIDRSPFLSFLIDKPFWFWKKKFTEMNPFPANWGFFLWCSLMFLWCGEAVMLIIGWNHTVLGRLGVAFPRGNDMEVCTCNQLLCRILALLPRCTGNNFKAIYMVCCLLLWTIDHLCVLPRKWIGKEENKIYLYWS